MSARTRQQETNRGGASRRLRIRPRPRERLSGREARTNAQALPRKRPLCSCPAVSPVANVVRIDEAGMCAAGKRTSAVPRPQRALQGCRHRALLAPDAQGLAIGPIHHRYHAAVAAQPLDVPHRERGCSQNLNGEFSMVIFRQSATTRNVIAVSIIAGLVAFLTLRAMEPAGPLTGSRTTELTSPDVVLDDVSDETIAMP